MVEVNFHLVNAEVNEEKIQAYIEAELVGSDFLVVDEEGRHAELIEYVQNSLWAFNPSFIMDNLREDIENDLSSYDRGQLENSLKLLQENMSEGANSIVRALIGDIEEFAEAAASVDGHGHFLGQYDNEEIEYKDEDGNELYIYRLG
jgi:hypothetical protein